MIGKRVLGAASAGVLLGCLGVLSACGSSTDESTGASAQAVKSANVSITLLDENGTAVGEGSGILIAPKLVLTSAHLVAGKAKWSITSAEGKKANGLKGVTYDWRTYDSLKAHPRKHDVAVIYLDRAINLPAYPKLATSTTAGEKVMRVRGNSTSFEMIESTLERVRQMPNAFTVSMPSSETLDTGGAVVNSKNEIVGLVTGRGMQTGKLYVARINELSKWLSPKVACGSQIKGSTLTTKTYGVPTPKPGCENDGGVGTSSSGGSSSGDTTSGGTSSGGTSSGGTSSGGTNGGDTNGTTSSSGSSGTGGGDVVDDNPGSCDSGGGFTFPGGGGTPGDNGGDTNGTVPGGTTGSSGGTGTSSSGGTTTSSGGTTSSSSGGTNGGDTTGTVPGTSSGSSGTGGTSTSGGTTTSSSGGTNTGDTTGTVPGTSSGGAGGTSSGGTTTSSGGTPGGDTTGTIPGGSSGSGGSSGGDEEVCEGENDNPDICPPETTTCEGANCGGANSPADDTIDYGNCSCSGSGGGSGPIILR